MTEFIKGMALGVVAGVAADLVLHTAQGKRTRAGRTMQTVTDAVDSAAASVQRTMDR